MKTILTRRSVRKFQDTPISRELILALIEAGCYAPSARNQQPWEFFVSSLELKPQLASISTGAKVIDNAPHVIIVAMNQNVILPGMAPLDCAAAIQNILLAAREQEIGTCWIGVYPIPERMEAVKELCKMEAHLTPMGMIALGYPASEDAFYQAKRETLSKVRFL